MVPQRPFLIGKPGWVRSSAWIWLFSSTHNTMACSGGFRYNPITSVIFSRNFGSRDSLNVFTPVRLQLVGLPDIVDRGLTHALTPGHRAATPMRHAFGFGLQRCIHNGGDLIGVVVWFAPASRSNLPQSVQALFREALAPQDHGLAVDGQLLTERLLDNAMPQHTPEGQHLFI